MFLSRFLNHFKDPHSTETDINLLLLGETGVGKSTFINSLSNYFNHPNFKKAQKAKNEVLIPVRINISDGKKIYGNPDENESHENGAACTQQVKIYLFPIKVGGQVINLRLVDTPGVGDPRGLDQDNINLDNILAYLATLKKLHGICFLLKSNQTRFTKFIEYCLKQILTRLDKSASDNIIFITTYSKTAQYTAGETMYHCLEPLVHDIKSKPPHVTIPLGEKNVFSVDNEAFKALLEMKEGKKYKPHELEGLAESWDVSYKECRRLFTYIIGDSKTSPLRPHEVANTVSVNEVRFLIEQLATPIAEVADVIQDNLRVLDRHKKNLSLEDQTLNQLKEQLFIPCVDLEIKELDQPVTICTNAEKCADIVKVNEVTKWHYRQKCHNPCYLRGIPKEVIGDPGLVGCAAMNGSQTCNQCGCHWQVHMHIYKTTEKVEVQKEDDNVKGAIKNREEARVQIESLMKKLNQRRSELEAESEIISESIAKFTYFLQEHALTPFNDAYSDYIQHLIKNEKSLGKFGDPAVIEKLQKLLAKHNQLQKTFQQSAEKFESMYGGFDLTPQGIKKSIYDLYNLKHMGPKIEELIRKTSACRLKETQKNFNCVVSQQINFYGGKVKHEKKQEVSEEERSVNAENLDEEVQFPRHDDDSECELTVDYVSYRRSSLDSNDTNSSKKSSTLSESKRNTSKNKRGSEIGKHIKSSKKSHNKVKTTSKPKDDSDEGRYVKSPKKDKYTSKSTSREKYEVNTKSSKLPKKERAVDDEREKSRSKVKTQSQPKNFSVQSKNTSNKLSKGNNYSEDKKGRMGKFKKESGRPKVDSKHSEEEGEVSQRESGDISEDSNSSYEQQNQKKRNRKLSRKSSTDEEEEEEHSHSEEEDDHEENEEQEFTESESDGSNSKNTKQKDERGIKSKKSAYKPSEAENEFDSMDDYEHVNKEE